MTTTITAIYEQGVLRLLEPLPMPEHTRVMVQVQAISPLDATEAQRQRVRAALMMAGLSLPVEANDNAPTPLSETERAALAETVGAGGSVSELIIEEREGR